MAGPLERDVPRRCWCGEAALERYSPEYLRCPRCASLVVAVPPDRPDRVDDEAASLYGLDYFDAHARAMGHPPLEERARLDLPERCAHWLEALLRYRPPPAATLELGCASGAFVALLAGAGYQATGLDLSPAVTELARRTFQVPVLTGRLEDQGLRPASLDVVVMMDVLEHLPDPLATLRRVAEVLRPDGLLLAQTPRFDPAASHADLVARKDPFLTLLIPEHLHLFSQGAARELLARAGLAQVDFVPAIFGHYDMSFVASRAPLAALPAGAGRAALRRTRAGRLVEAILDARDSASRAQAEVDRLHRAIDASEADHSARLEYVHQQERELERLRGEISMLEERAARAGQAGAGAQPPPGDRGRGR